MTKTATREPAKDITYVPVTTMEAVPELSEAERAALLTSIKEAEADIAAGRFIEFGPGEFGPWLRERVEAIRRKKHGL